MRTTVFFLFLAVFALQPFISRAEEVTLTLDEAVSIALRDNRDMLLKTGDLNKAKAAINEARAALFPSLSAKASWSDTRGFYSKDAGVTSGQIEVRQLIYAGGKVMNAVKAGEYNYEASAAVMDRTRQEIILNTKKAFYTLLLGGEYAALNKGILDNTLEHLDYSRSRFSAGEASRSDMLTIEASLAGVNEVYLSSLNQIEAAKETLRNILCIDKEVELKISGGFSYEPIDIVYDQAFLKAMRQRPEIRQYEAQSNSAERNIEAARAGNRPSVYASWDYYSQSHLPSSTSRNTNDYNILGITVSWPVFDGWLTRSKIDQAIVDLKQARLLSDKNIRDIALEVKTAYLGLKNAIERTVSIDSQNKVYHDNLAVAQGRYNAGEASGLALHDARLSYSISLFNKVQAEYDYLIAKAVFEKAQGGF